MDVPARRESADSDAHEVPAAIVSAHETRPGKLVLTERGNTDGWIATNLAVTLER